jgi:hypothetical protein
VVSQQSRKAVFGEPIEVLVLPEGVIGVETDGDKRVHGLPAAAAIRKRQSTAASTERYSSRACATRIGNEAGRSAFYIAAPGGREGSES